MLNINELKKYPLIYVIGHKNLDADSIISAYLLANILKTLGINSEYAILNENYNVVYDDEDLIKDHLNFNPYIIDSNEIENNYFILVDHNNPIQSVGDTAEVVGIIDHHFTVKNIPNCLIGIYASTASYIYELFKEIYQFTDEEKKLIILAILSDTAFLKTSRYRKKDAKILLELNKNLNLDPEKLCRKYFRTNDFSKGVEVNFYSNHKKYKYDKLEFECTYVRAKSEDLIYLDEYIEYLKGKETDWLFIWYEYDTANTFAYLKHDNKIKEFKYNFIASRANNIIKDVIKK